MYHGSMIRELRTLIAIAQDGTFSAAGARLGLTQSAVSAQMQKLEQALGVPLFERTKRTAILNDAGQNALSVAHEIVALFDSLVSRPGMQALAPLLRVGALASAQPVLLTRALAPLRQRIPNRTPPRLAHPFVLARPAASLYTDWREALRHEPFVRYDRASFGGRQIEQFLRR